MPAATLTEAQLQALKDEFSLTLSPEKLNELIENPNSEYNKARAVNLAIEVGKQKKTEENLEIERQNALIEKQLREAQPTLKKETALQRTVRVIREYNLENAQTQQLVANLKKMQAQVPKLQDKLNTLLAQRNDILQKIEKLELRSQKLDVREQALNHRSKAINERTQTLKVESTELEKQSKNITNAIQKFQAASTFQAQIVAIKKIKEAITPGEEGNISAQQPKLAATKLENNKAKQVDIAKENSQLAEENKMIAQENTEIAKERKEITKEVKELKKLLVENTQAFKETLQEFQQLNKSIASMEAQLGLNNNSKDASPQEWMSPKFTPSFKKNKNKEDEENQYQSTFSNTK